MGRLLIWFGRIIQQHPTHILQELHRVGIDVGEWYESKDGKQRFLTEDEARQLAGMTRLPKPERCRRASATIAVRMRFLTDLEPTRCAGISLPTSHLGIRSSTVKERFETASLSSNCDYGTSLASSRSTPRSTASLVLRRPMARSISIHKLTPQELARFQDYRPVRERSELDRWMMSELARTSREVVLAMDRYDNYSACLSLTNLVEGLSNWFVRRSRARTVSEDKRDRDKLDAYWTLYECLVNISKLIAPFVPFMAESLWRHLTECVREHARPQRSSV